MRRGLTLAELTVSLLATSLVMGGMMSALLIAGKAIPQAGSATGETLSRTAAVNQILADLAAAESVLASQAQAIEFTVPDRDNNGAPERLLYGWTANNGGTLLRRLNGGDLVPFVRNLTACEFAYDVEVSTSAAPGDGLTQSGELLITQFEGWPLIPPTAYQARPVSNVSRAMWTFQPPALIDTEELAFTRIAVRLSRTASQPPAALWLEVHDAGANTTAQPTGAPLVQSAEVSSDTFTTTARWVDFTFPKAVISNTQQRFRLLLNTAATIPCAQVEVHFSPQAVVDPFTFAWSNGSILTVLPTPLDANFYDAPLRVYGTFVDDGNTHASSHKFIRAVHIALTPGGGGAPMRTRVPLFNSPERLP